MPGEGSDVEEDTDAEFVIEEADAGAVSTTVMAGAVAPEASDGRVHMMDALSALVHDQPVPDANTNVTPGGRVSSTETDVARPVREPAKTPSSPLGQERSGFGAYRVIRFAALRIG